jgi:peptidoglycan/LPS O-acetylase OafA/YrhL
MLSKIKTAITSVDRLIETNKPIGIAAVLAASLFITSAMEGWRSGAQFTAAISVWFFAVSALMQLFILFARRKHASLKRLIVFAIATAVASILSYLIGPSGLWLTSWAYAGFASLFVAPFVFMRQED